MSGLIDELKARKGVVSFVGAGGKKSTMFRIADAHPGRVALTATAHIERFPRRFREAAVIGAGEDLMAGIRDMQSARVVSFAHDCDLPGRYAGMSDAELKAILAEGEFDVCLIKADGARGRLIKAPAEHEPALSAHTTSVVTVVSARAIGMALNDKLAHRPERVAAVTGARIDEPLTPLHVARLLASSEGLLKKTEGLPVTPLINMVDDADRQALAHEAATLALKLTDRFDQVVLGAMKKTNPVVAVVNRL